MVRYTMKEKFSKNVILDDNKLYVGLILNVEKDCFDIPYITHDNDYKYNNNFYLLSYDKQNLEYQKCTKPIGVSIFKTEVNSDYVYDILTGEKFLLVSNEKKYKRNTNGKKITTFVAVTIDRKSEIDQNYCNLLFNMEKFNKIKIGDFKFDENHNVEYDKEIYDSCTKMIFGYVEEYNKKNNRKIKPKDIGFLSKESLKVKERELYDDVEKKFIDLAVKNTTRLNKKMAIDYLVNKDINLINRFKEYNHDNFDIIVKLLKNFYEKRDYKEVFQYIVKHNENDETVNKDFYLNIIEKANNAKSDIKCENISTEEEIKNENIKKYILK